MSATVSVIFAVAMLVLLVWAIMKKLQPVMVLWVIGTIAPDYCGRCKSRGYCRSIQRQRCPGRL